MKKNLLILITFCISVIGYAQSTFTIDGITYNLEQTNYTAVAASYVSVAGSDVNIPPTINVLVQYDVIGIATGAFQQKGLTSVIIPNSITTIDGNAFRDNNLTSVTIPNSVTSLGVAAFRDNQIDNLVLGNGITNISDHAFLGNNLTSFTVPNNIITIGNSAFSSNQLTNITIPNSVTDIGNFAFLLNPLTQITSQGTTPATITTASSFDSFSNNRSNIDLIIPNGTTAAYTTDPGALWTGFNSVTEALVVGNTFVSDFISYQVTSTALNTVEIIDYDMAGGTIVNIPTSVSYGPISFDVTSIAFNAFNSKGLTSVIISDNITNIGDQAFVNNSLISLTIGNSVETIGNLVFYNNNLTSVIIPDSVTAIGGRAFDDNQITTATIGNSVTSIGIAAFRYNPLTTVTSLAITPPTIVTSSSFPLITDSFSNDRSGINLILPNATTDEYVTASGALWTGFKMVHEITSPNELKVTEYDSANGTNVSIAATITATTTTYDITEIGISAFFDKGLTSVTIPNSITTIGTSAFNTNNLTSVTIPDSVISIGSQAFVTNDLTSLIIGNSVTNIDFGAFADNDLTDIAIPSSVTTIGLVAFAANPLTSVTSFATTPPTITTGINDTFNITGDRSNIHLHIPPGTLGAYVTDTGALWTGFNPVTEDAALSNSDYELNNNITVITNTDELKVKSSGSAKLKSYIIYSISGAEVKNGSESTIAINTLSNGIYILELTFDTGKLVKKFAK